MQKCIVIFFLLFSLNLSAKDVEVPIETLIEKINSSKGDERRNLMNSLKLRLRRVNSESRKKIAIELKKSLNRGQSNRKYQSNSKYREHHRKPIYRQIGHNHHMGRHR